MALARLAKRRTSLLADRQALANGKATDEEGELIDVTFVLGRRGAVPFEDRLLTGRDRPARRQCLQSAGAEIRATAKAYQRELRTPLLKAPQFHHPAHGCSRN